MANISVVPSTYDTGGIDTRDQLTASSEATFQNMNGATSAIVALETILGDGPTLKGTQADFATRYALEHDSTGAQKLLHVSQGGTGFLIANQGLRLLGKDTTSLQAVPMWRVSTITTSSDFVVPADVTQLYVEVYGPGGGGGGGGGGAGGDGSSFGGNGGSGSKGTYGGYAASLVTVSPAQVIAVTIGAVGAGGGGGAGVDLNSTGGTGANGGTGGTVSFGGFAIANGGFGGIGGNGGTGSNNTPVSGTPGTSEGLDVGLGVTGDILLDGHGMAPGPGNGGGSGSQGTGDSGSAGFPGKPGKVIVWY